MKKVKKGEPGYITYEKVRQILSVFIFLLIMAIIFFTGYIRYHHTKSIFTVLAVLSVLPAAKHFAVYCVLIPYRSVKKELYDKVISNGFEGTTVCDLVLTTQEKVSNVDMACIRDGHIVMYTKNEKTSTKFTTDYVKEFMSKEYKVKGISITREEQKFLKSVEHLMTYEEGKYDQNMAELMLAMSV